MDTDKHLQQELPFPTVTSTTKKWRCPECSSENLMVSVRAWASLYQGPENFETDDLQGDHEWDASSLMQCRECSYVADSIFFEVLL